MATYLVEMHGEAREVYAVEANSEEEAIRNWDFQGHLVVSESSSMEFYSVREDD